MKAGDKVYYKPDHFEHKRWENGIVKEVREEQPDVVWVVYNCDGSWDDYMNYTSARTNLRDLKIGWRYI